MAGAAPAGGAVPVPPPALVAPAVAHGFARCIIPGADNTLDYLSTPGGAKMVSAFPDLGWINVPAAPGFKAAPALSIQGVTCCAAFSSDWTGPVLAPQLRLSELTACFSLAYMSRAADALASLGLLDKTFTRDRAFFDDWEVAMPRVPSPSAAGPRASSTTEAASRRSASRMPPLPEDSPIRMCSCASTSSSQCDLSPRACARCRAELCTPDAGGEPSTNLIGTGSLMIPVV